MAFAMPFTGAQQVAFVQPQPHFIQPVPQVQLLPGAALAPAQTVQLGLPMQPAAVGPYQQVQPCGAAAPQGQLGEASLRHYRASPQGGVDLSQIAKELAGGAAAVSPVGAVQAANAAAAAQTNVAVRQLLEQHQLLEQQRQQCAVQLASMGVSVGGPNVPLGALQLAGGVPAAAAPAAPVPPQGQQQQQQQGERGMLKFPLDSLPSGMEVSAFAAALRHQQQQEEKQRSGQPDAGRKDGKKKRPKGAEGDADRSGGRPGGGAGRDAHPDPAVITAVPAGGSQQSRATLQIGATGGPVQQLDQQQLILQMQAQQQQQLQLQQQQQLQLQLQVQQQQMLVQQPHAVAGAVPVNVVPAAVPLQQTIVPAAPLTPGEPQHGSHGFLQTSLGVAAPEPIRAEDLEAALS